MKKLSKTKAELKKRALIIKKACIATQLPNLLDQHALHLFSYLFKRHYLVYYFFLQAKSIFQIHHIKHCKFFLLYISFRSDSGVGIL